MTISLTNGSQLMMMMKPNANDTAAVRVFLYPGVDSQSTLDSLVSRLAWYLAPYLSRVKGIELHVSDKKLIESVRLAPHLDPSISNRIPEVKNLIIYRSAKGLEYEMHKADAKNDLLLIFDQNAEKLASRLVKEAIATFSQSGGCYRVDPDRTRQEGSHYLWAGLNKLADPAALVESNRIRFGLMRGELGTFSRAHVFGTGPSFSNYISKRSFEGDLCIVANSIVKNDEALEVLKPRIICAADPIYHAGCSSYAAAFRRSLIAALDRSGAWFVCPLRDLSVYDSFLPTHLKERTVGIPFNANGAIPTDLNQTFYLRPFGNVLTLLLLPLAATFADSISIAGCDGRRLLDDSFFWAHDKKVQFNDQMSEIQAAHPGFFSIDYNDYYLDHCFDLEKVLTEVEATGKQIYNETTSYIPALEHRSRRPPPEPRAFKTFAMIDPDAKDSWGHFLAYDKRLASAASGLGLQFALLCRQDLKVDPRPQEIVSMHPVFSLNSWTIGNKAPASRKSILEFAHEMKSGLTQIEHVYEGDICLFFYVGSIEAAEILEFLLVEHPRVTAVINLFWSYNFDQAAPAYANRWKEVAYRINAHPRIYLMHSTAEIAREFERDWRLYLPVLQHPSTTFSDEVSGQLERSPPRKRSLNADRRWRILFPGGARAEKGFMLSIETIELLRSDTSLEVVFRAHLDRVSGPQLNKAFDDLAKEGLSIVDGELSDEAFVELLDSSDVIVIPYHSAAFRRRTSGILVDAMLLGKPVVVLEDTWMSNIVTNEGIGISVRPDAGSIARGVLEIIRAYDDFSENLAAARRSYLVKNSWRSLVQSVCATGGDPRFVDSAENDIGFPVSLVKAISSLLLYTSGMYSSQSEPASFTQDMLDQSIALLGEGHPVCVHYNEVKSYMASKSQKTAT